MRGSEKLPQGALRIAALVERSAPAIDRPRLPDEWEHQLAPVDALSAACYASMEDLSDQLGALATAIEQEPDPFVVEGLEGVDREEDSLVINLDAIRDRLSTPDHLPPPPASDRQIKR